MFGHSPTRGTLCPREITSAASQTLQQRQAQTLNTDHNARLGSDPDQKSPRGWKQVTPSHNVQGGQCVRCGRCVLASECKKRNSDCARTSESRTSTATNMCSNTESTPKPTAQGRFRMVGSLGCAFGSKQSFVLAVLATRLAIADLASCFSATLCMRPSRISHLFQHGSCLQDIRQQH